MDNKSILKGTFYFSIARILFLILGYFVNIFLAKYLQPVAYGTWGVILGLLMIYQQFFNIGVQNAISKFISISPNIEMIIFRKSMLFQIIFGSVFGLLIYFASPFIANLFHEDTILPYIQFTGLFAIAYSLLGLYLGFFNGTRMFLEQSIINIVYSALRASFIIILILLGFKIWGALLATLFSILLSCIISHIYIHKKKGAFKKNDDYNFSIKKFLFFLSNTSFTSLLLNVIMYLDLFYVKTYCSNQLVAGYYNSALLIAQIPYMFFIGVGASLFPNIANAIQLNEIEKVKKYFNNTLKYTLLILIPLTMIISVSSNSIIEICFSSVYLPAAQSLSILIFGYLFLTLLFIISTLFTAAGQHKLALWVVLGVVLIDIILNSLLVPQYYEKGAAISTLISCAIGGVIIYYIFLKKYNLRIEIKTIVTVLISSILLYVLFHLFEKIGINIFISYLILAVLYLSILLLFKLIEEERKQFLKIISRFL